MDEVVCVYIYIYIYLNIKIRVTHFKCSCCVENSFFKGQMHHVLNQGSPSSVVEGRCPCRV